MLILSRRVGQSIFIGDDIEVRIQQVDGRSGAVRVGIKAPREVEVDREEIRMRRNREKRILCAP